jgi:hypothetical protein
MALSVPTRTCRDCNESAASITCLDVVLNGQYAIMAGWVMFCAMKLVGGCM